MTTPSLTRSGRLLILAVAFLGWLCAGMHMSITQLAGQPAAIDLLSATGSLDAERYRDLTRAAKTPKLGAEDQEQLAAWAALVGRWFTWYQCAFLFGAATGGLVFGWVGDHLGRARGMAASIFTYSGMALVASCAPTPELLLLCWYLACTGVGGMWPNGVALVSEAWSGMSRPLVAGVIGTAANIGMFVLASLALLRPITADDWRWVYLVGACPLALGLVALLVPESPKWRAAKQDVGPPESVFRPPYLGVTLLGIVLATTPLIGGWGSANWMIPWADKAGDAATPPDPTLKASVQQIRALTGIVGSFLGGWIASVCGRRLSYFLVSLCSLLVAQYTFWCLYPTDAGFLFWVGVLGFFSGIYFGWMPLFLPELFPTRVRATGSGVSFNFGRIVTALTLFATGLLMHVFNSDYARIGQVTSLIFAVGMVAIWFAPHRQRHLT